MPRGPKGERRPADVNARAVMIGKIGTEARVKKSASKKSRTVADAALVTTRLVTPALALASAARQCRLSASRSSSHTPSRTNRARNAIGGPAAPLRAGARCRATAAASASVRPSASRVARRRGPKVRNHSHARIAGVAFSLPPATDWCGVGAEHVQTEKRET
jgi:hypothetical protein